MVSELMWHYCGFYSRIYILLFQQQNADTFSSHNLALLYVRATLLVAQCKPIPALEDLCRMNVIDDRLFPAE